MRKMRIALIIAFVLVAALTAWQKYYIQPRRDTQAPVFQCDSSVLDISVEDGEEELLAGITAWDDRDGDVTDKIIVEHISPLISANTAQVTYAVFDEAENVSKLSRTVRYTDYHKPHFTLSEPLIYDLGDTISLEDRLGATDVIDGDISSKMRLTTLNLSNNAEGVYHITVQVTNSLGDTSVLTLSVMVQHKTGVTPTIHLTEQLIYLRHGDAFDPMGYISKVEDPGKVGSVSRSSVAISSEVDVNTPGTYEVNYFYTGQSDDCRAILTVVVE